jgi:methionine synthase II (cobalamin-independent)
MPPFRAEHIGSLLRPADLVLGGEDAAIARVIRWQEGLGLKVVTDGEFRRESWRLGFVTKVEGFARAEAVGEVDVQRDDAGKAARYVPLEDLSLSPQCGFASHRKGTALSFAEQEAKLRLVVATAAEVWGGFTAP